MVKVLMVASEAEPFAKSGGLGDVLGALPAALAAQGHSVAMVLPRYGWIPLGGLKRVYEHLVVWLGQSPWPADVYSTTERGVEVFLIDCPPLYDREGLYSANGAEHADNAERFAVLARGALEIVRCLFRPQILHCHDWQAALAGPYMRHTLALDPTFLGIKLVLTIHNLCYQGLFPPEVLPAVGLDRSLYRPEALEFWGQVNFLKGGIVFADAITTVSPTYAREIQTPEFGCGLDGLLRARAAVLTGILNGADYSQWNPETDPFIAARYSAEDLSGKRACKRDLLAECGFDPDDDRPVIGMVSRLAAQKGFDLVAEAAEDLAAENLYLVILGAGDAYYEDRMRRLAAEHPRNVAVRIGFDNAFAHKIEAGADMFLMPSHYEPCGLNQIYSLRYGTVPIVRATGGLDDTVDETTGFKFVDYNAAAMLEAVRRALEAYRDREGWRAMMRRGMRKDYSWDASARQYAELYRSLLG
jgi:starch synthase